jgi:hypothetical protein
VDAVEEVGHVVASAEVGGVDSERADVLLDCCFGVEVSNIFENALGDCGVLAVYCNVKIDGVLTLSYIDQRTPD